MKKITAILTAAILAVSMLAAQASAEFTTFRDKNNGTEISSGEIENQNHRTSVSETLTISKTTEADATSEEESEEGIPELAPETSITLSGPGETDADGEHVGTNIYNPWTENENHKLVNPNDFYGANRISVRIHVTNITDMFYAWLNFYDNTWSFYYYGEDDNMGVSCDMVPITGDGYYVINLDISDYYDESSESTRTGIITGLNFMRVHTNLKVNDYYDCDDIPSIEIDAITINGTLEDPDGETEIPFSEFSYEELDDGTIVITGYNGISSVVEIPAEIDNKKVTSIGSSAFESKKITSVTIPDGVTSIGGKAFYNCTSLASITIPDSVTSIGDFAFYSCASLTSIVIPGNVTSIGVYAFHLCESLTSITIPDSVTNIGFEAFANCKSLTDITVDDNNEFYTSVKGVLFNKDKTTLIIYPCGKTDTEYTIPDGVTRIDASAFGRCKSLTSVIVPDSVKTISVWAFEGCGSLVSINIPDGVTNINPSTFSGCASLTSVAIPKSVKTIGNAAFLSCISLTSITIPDSVTSIGADAFYGCNSLVINCYENSTAHQYAIDNGIDYELIPTELAPSVLSATAGDKQATLNWTAVDGASYYQIIRYNKGAYSLIANISGTTATVKGLTNNFEYTYLIKAVAEDGRTSFSNAVTVTPVAALGKSTLSATAGNGQATLSWTAVDGASYYQIIRYNKGNYSLIANISGTSATVKGLTNGYEYTYLVKAVAADGRTSLSSAVNVTPVAALAKPTLSATAGNAQATLSWTKVEGASYYQIIRYNAGNYTLIANISGTSATVKGLTNNFEYTYLVKAVAADGRTSLSSAVNVTPVAALAKPILSATAGDKQATLSWTAVSGASYYQIIRYNKGAYSLIANISGTSATVKGLTNNFEYTYLIKAVAEDGSSSLSTAVKVTPVAAVTKPTLSATAGDKQATLSWTAVNGASYYQIIRYNKGAYSLIANISSTSATVKGLTNNFEYTYLIKAVMSDGTVIYSNAVNVTPKA